MPKNRTSEHMEITFQVEVRYNGSELLALREKDPFFVSHRTAVIRLEVPYLEDSKYINLAKVLEGLTLETVADHAQAIKGLYGDLYKEKKDREAKEKDRLQAQALGLVFPEEDLEEEE